MDSSIPSCLDFDRGPHSARPLDRFPYGILYYVHGDAIVVTAVMNLRQKPRSMD